MTIRDELHLLLTGKMLSREAYIIVFLLGVLAGIIGKVVMG